MHELTNIGGTSGESLASQCAAAYAKMTVSVDLLKVSLPRFCRGLCTSKVLKSVLFNEKGLPYIVRPPKTKPCLLKFYKHDIL